MGKTWRQLTTCPADQLTLLVDVLGCGGANPFASLPEAPLQSRNLAEERLIPSRPKKKRTLIGYFRVAVTSNTGIFTAVEDAPSL